MRIAVTLWIGASLLILKSFLPVEALRATNLAQSAEKRVLHASGVSMRRWMLAGERWERSFARIVAQLSELIAEYNQLVVHLKGAIVLLRLIYRELAYGSENRATLRPSDTEDRATRLRCG